MHFSGLRLSQKVKQIIIFDQIWLFKIAFLKFMATKTKFVFILNAPIPYLSNKV